MKRIKELNSRINKQNFLMFKANENNKDLAVIASNRKYIEIFNLENMELVFKQKFQCELKNLIFSSENTIAYLTKFNILFFNYKTSKQEKTFSIQKIKELNPNTSITLRFSNEKYSIIEASYSIKSGMNKAILYSINLETEEILELSYTELNNLIPEYFFNNKNKLIIRDINIVSKEPYDFFLFDHESHLNLEVDNDQIIRILEKGTINTLNDEYIIGSHRHNIYKFKYSIQLEKNSILLHSLSLINHCEDIRGSGEIFAINEKNYIYNFTRNPSWILEKTGLGKDNQVVFSLNDHSSNSLEKEKITFLQHETLKLKEVSEMTKIFYHPNIEREIYAINNSFYSISR